MSGIKIAIYSLGSTIRFKKRHKRSDGSSEYYKLIKTLAKRESIDEIILLSRNDYHELSESVQRELDPRKIIRDPYTEFSHIKVKPKTKDLDERYAYLERFSDTIMKNYQIDFGIGFMAAGYHTVTTQPGFINTVTIPDRRAQVLDMTLFYASPIVNYLNRSGINWWLIATDPRYVKENLNLRDTANLPRRIIGQYDFTVNWRSLETFNRNAPFVIRQVESFYSGVEKMNLIDESSIPPDSHKPYKFNVVSIQLMDPESQRYERFNILKEYILDYDPNEEVMIFGKWEDEIKNKYNQFQGYVPTEELDDVFRKTRYSFVLPTKDRWVTSKYAELLQLGIVPFLHKHYDDQNHIVDGDYFIKIKNPQDLYEKIEYLEQNPQERIDMVKNLQQKLIKDAETGDFIVDIINNELKREGLGDYQIDYKIGESKHQPSLF